MTNDTFNPSIYDDPNCLLGADEADFKITKHKEQWHLNFAGDRYSICINHPSQYTPLTITSHVPSEGSINWELSKDPLWWHFEPNLKLTTSSPEPNNWTRTDFIKALSTWSPKEDTHPLLIPIIRGHYTGLAFWLLLDEIRGSEKKNKLAGLLWNTSLVHLYPHVEFCQAKKKFAHAIFTKVKLAQCADDRDLLWLAIEYSSFLHKNQLDYEQKTSWREPCTKLINTCQKAIDNGFDDEFPTIKYLQTVGEDWREYIISLLVKHTIKTARKDKDENLKFACREFLASWDRYVRIVGHLKTHQIYYQDSKGDLRVTCKGHRKGKRVAPLILASRLPT